MEQFIERYSVDISRGGIFIRTKEPLSVGTPIRFDFQLQDTTPLLSGEGTVVWTREPDPGRTGVAPGMGVRFDKLTPIGQQMLERILTAKATRGEAQAESRFDAGMRSHATASHSPTEDRDSKTPLPQPVPGFGEAAGTFASEEMTRVMQNDEARVLAGRTRDRVASSFDRDESTVQIDARTVQSLLAGTRAEEAKEVAAPKAAAVSPMSERDPGNHLPTAQRDATPIPRADATPTRRADATPIPRRADATPIPRRADTTPIPRRADATPTRRADATPIPRRADATPIPRADATPTRRADATPTRRADATPIPRADATPIPRRADATPIPRADPTPIPNSSAASAQASSATDMSVSAGWTGNDEPRATNSDSMAVSSPSAGALAPLIRRWAIPAAVGLGVLVVVLYLLLGRGTPGTTGKAGHGATEASAPSSSTAAPIAAPSPAPPTAAPVPNAEKP